MDKAIEIKRRAQRCILNGDLNGALLEYESLVAIGDPDPYYCVLLADLLYKMGNPSEAQKRYLEAIEGYSKSGLYKNGIAVCKKLSRLSLAPVEVPRWLAQLYSLDGFGNEAGLAYQQLAEVLVKHDRIDEARAALQQAIQVGVEVARLYERLGEIEVLAGDQKAAGDAWSDAAERFERAGQAAEVTRCRSRIAQLRLTTPPRSASPEIEDGPAVAKLEVSGSLEWQAPGAGEIDFESMTISHGPPSPEEAERTEGQRRDDAAADVDPRGAVRVEHGFGRLDPTAPRPNGDDAGEAEVALPLEDLEAADSNEPAEDREFPEATEAPTETAEAAPVFEPAPVSAATDDAAADVAEVPAPAAGLSLVGLDPHENVIETEAAAHATLDNVPVMPRALAPPRFVMPPEPMAPLKLAGPPMPAPSRAPAALPMPSGPPARVPAGASALPPLALVPPPAASIHPPVPVATPPVPAGAGFAIQRFSDVAPPGESARATTDRHAALAAAASAPQVDAEDAGLAQVSLILGEAQACFHAGDRDAATMALIRAAQAYDQIGRLDSAVAIYRSLGQSPDVSLQLMMLWLKNCQRRDDRPEAARVACDLGDRALNDDDVPGAREWFERARSFDVTNELAARRLHAMNAPPQAQAPAGAPAPIDSGHLNVRTGRDEPVIVDLGTLIEEFQRAVEPELESDPQGQYDLGMSYREMGLMEQAVRSLRAAARVPAFRLRAGELAGRCLLDQGMFEEAAEVLRDALGAPDLQPSAAVDLRYQLALALEAAGNTPEALIEFEGVYATQSNYPDVAMKIRLLRKLAEAA